MKLAARAIAQMDPQLGVLLSFVKFEAFGFGMEKPSAATFIGHASATLAFLETHQEKLAILK